MKMGLLSRMDPLVRLLVLAVLLASFLPVGAAGRGIAQAISDMAVFLLFLLNGLRLSRGDVLRGMGHMRFLLPLVCWVFGAMALAGWGMSLLIAPWLPPLVALGFLYLGVLPSTVQSATAYSSLAGGNVASSVVAAALLNILGVFISAPLFSVLAGGEGAPVSVDAFVKVCLILLLPFIIGQIAQKWARGWVMENKDITGHMDRSAIAIAVYVAFSSAVEQGIWTAVSPIVWVYLCLAVCVLMVVGFAGSWLLGGALKLARPERIAMMFAGAQKSIAMGAPLATVLFPPAQAGIILLPILVYHQLQLVVSAPLASRLRRSGDEAADNQDLG